MRGRRTTVDAPDTLDSNGATLANVVTTTYNPDSTVAETNGDQTYRTTHSYDYADRQIGMTTYGGTTATTTWNYTTDRGFLSRKEYHDGNGTDYTYTDAGRLATRTWARGVVTTYNYDNAGRLTLTNYSDTTPDVVITYDAMNRPVTNTNGVATTTFAYNASTLQLDTETLAYDFDTDGNIDFTRVIDRSRDGLQRLTGFELKDGTIVENQAIYAYSAADGRLASVANGADSFNYNYLSNSNLLATVTSTVHTVTNTWEGDRNVLNTKTNADLASTPVTVSEYDYSVNDLGQRTNVATSGTAFPATPSWDWGYNAKGEIVKADSSNNPFDLAFQYDGIGNRIEAVDGATSLTGTANYAANALNQYTAVGAINPVYDLDGNATVYPLPANASANSALTWDAENRLISTTVSGTTTSYQYDSQSRRISKTTGATTTIYVYDGWNVIAEYDGTSTPALTTTYTWGMDLSGSMQGAGGVGGLLSTTNSTGTYYPTFDGNGNVSEYLDNAGVIAAHFEYDPFGNTVVDTDTTAQFAYRFSTKPIDPETGLYYYGYRYYDPLTGRWPSRDPIGERGGYNLYGFVGNDGVNGGDLLGERIITKEGEPYRKKVVAALEGFTGAELSWEIDKDIKLAPRFIGGGDWYVLCVDKEGSDRWWDDLNKGIESDINIYITQVGSDGKKNPGNAAGRLKGDPRRVELALNINFKIEVDSGKKGSDDIPIWEKKAAGWNEVLWHELVAHTILEKDHPNDRPNNAYVILDFKGRFDKLNRTGFDEEYPDPTIAYMNEFRTAFSLPLRRPQYWDYYNGDNRVTYSITGKIPEDKPENYPKK